MTIVAETRFAGDILRVALALPTPSLSPVQAPKRSEFVSSVSPVEFLGKVRCLSSSASAQLTSYASYSSRIPVLGAFIRA
jgi:hypothetical protein